MESTQGLPLEVRLSAYLDGQLSHSEIREIDVMLARDEKARTLFNRLKLGSDLGRKAFEDMLHDPVPLDLVRSIKQASAEAGHDRARSPLSPPTKEAPAKDRLWRLAGAGLALLAAGIGAGYLAAAWQNPVAPPVHIAVARNWLDDVADYHRLYARQSRHLVEVPASESQHITQWLTTAVGVDFSIPDLSEKGLTFEGARLLVAGSMPTAQLIYRDQDGDIFAVCFQKSEPVPEMTEMTDSIRDDLGLVSWQRGAGAFVVIGPSSDPQLDAIATTVAETI